MRQIKNPSVTQNNLLAFAVRPQSITQIRKQLTNKQNNQNKLKLIKEMINPSGRFLKSNKINEKQDKLAINQVARLVILKDKASNIQERLKIDASIALLRLARTPENLQAAYQSIVTL